MKHTWIFWAAILLCMSFLAGCQKPSEAFVTTKSGSTSGESATSETPVTTVTPITTVTPMTTETPITTEAPDTTSPNAGAESLAALQSDIRASDSIVGIAKAAFIDQDLSDKDAELELRNSELAKSYPFIENTKFAARQGIVLFVLVPVDAQTKITVYPVETAVVSERLELKTLRDVVICESEPGEPIAIRCNDNENYSNVLVSVTNGERTVEFYPMISLEDGWSIALYDGCFDFSLRDIRAYIYPATMLLPDYISEIKESLDNGYEMIYGGEISLNDQTMLCFELGKFTSNEEGYSSDGFVCERQYAVSFDATYAKNVNDADWQKVGVGIDGMVVG